MDEIAGKKSFDKLDEVGQLIIECFKNSPLKSLDEMLKGKSKATLKRGLQDKISRLDEETQDLIRACVSESLLMGVTDFLNSLEELYHTEDSKVAVCFDGQNIVELAEDNGMRPAWYPHHDEGWDVMFSDYPLLNEIHEKYNAQYDAQNKNGR